MSHHTNSNYRFYAPVDINIVSCEIVRKIVVPRTTEKSGYVMKCARFVVNKKNLIIIHKMFKESEFWFG